MDGYPIAPADPRLPNLLEAAEAAAWLSLASGPGGSGLVESRQIGGGTIILGRGAVRPPSRVFCLGLERAAGAAVLDEILRVYRDAGEMRFEVKVCPTARPSLLRRRLEDRGFRLEAREMVLARPTQDAEPPDRFFRIRDARSEDREAVGRVMSEAGDVAPEIAQLLAGTIGTKGWCGYMAVEDGRPFSVSGIFCNGAVAWMSPGWTLAGYRNRGAHAALIAHGIIRAREAGCVWVTTAINVSSVGRQRNFERNGFQFMYQRLTYVWQEPET
jgi:hypothetical protein